jgi:hypothetical protein
MEVPLSEMRRTMREGSLQLEWGLGILGAQFYTLCLRCYLTFKGHFSLWTTLSSNEFTRKTSPPPPLPGNQERSLGVSSDIYGDYLRAEQVAKFFLKEEEATTLIKILLIKWQSLW